MLIIEVLLLVVIACMLTLCFAVAALADRLAELTGRLAESNRPGVAEHESATARKQNHHEQAQASY